MTARLAAVDLLRGIAILLVVHEHVTCKFIPFASRWAHPVLTAMPTTGYYGVNAFFVLSGFVLFLPWVSTDVPRPVGVWRFYRRRALRILPLYYLTLAVAFVAWEQPPRGAWWHLGLVATFLFQFTELHFFPRFNPVLWSLGVEVMFSALLPLLAAAFRRVGAVRVVAPVVALALGTRFVGVALGGVLPITDGVAGRLDDFVVGMAAAWVYVRAAPPRAPWLWIATGVALYQLGCQWSNVWQMQAALGVPGARELRALVAPELVSVGIFALLRGLSAPTVRIGGAALQAIGRMSYSIYLWHLVVREVLFPVHGVQSLGDLLGYTAVLLGLSVLTYRGVELTISRAR